MEIIDLEEQRKASRKKKRAAKKDKDIGRSCKVEGSDGTYYLFMVTYQFKGKNWTFELWAKNKREAELRVFNIKQFPVEVSQIHDRIPI